MAKGKVDKSYLDRLNAEVSGMSGIDKELVAPLLVEVAAMASMVEELRQTVQEKGVLIEVVKGGANNRHTELVENPALTAYSKLAGRLSDLAKKVSGFAKGSKDEEVDELAAFVTRR